MRLIAISQSTHTTHDTQHVVVNSVDADLARAATSDSGGGQGQLQGSIINAREVAGAGWLVLLWAQGEGVHVDAARWHVLVVLIWLYQVEVLAIANGEPVVAVELEEGLRDRVLAALERHWQVHIVSTTSCNTWHSTGELVGRVWHDNSANTSVGLSIGICGCA